MTLTLKASELLKHNIDALLRARGQKRPELSRYCRRSRSWLDKIFSEQRREVPLKYLDRIADFFGIATYQLFQPGISPLTERRTRSDRRSWRDRRISQATLSQKPGDVDLVDLFRALSRDNREDLIADAVDRLNKQLKRPQTAATARAAQDRTDETARATPAPVPALRKR